MHIEPNDEAKGACRAFDIQDSRFNIQYSGGSAALSPLVPKTHLNGESGAIFRLAQCDVRCFQNTGCLGGCTPEKRPTFTTWASAVVTTAMSRKSLLVEELRRVITNRRIPDSAVMVTVGLRLWQRPFCNSGVAKRSDFRGAPGSPWEGVKVLQKSPTFAPRVLQKSGSQCGLRIADCGVRNVLAVAHARVWHQQPRWAQARAGISRVN